MAWYLRRRKRRRHDADPAYQGKKRYAGKPNEPKKDDAEDNDEVDEASIESFPASDPPSWNPGEASDDGIPKKPNGKKKPQVTYRDRSAWRSRENAIFANKTQHKPILSIKTETRR